MRASDVSPAKVISLLRTGQTAPPSVIIIIMLWKEASSTARRVEFVSTIPAWQVSRRCTSSFRKAEPSDLLPSSQKMSVGSSLRPVSRLQQHHCRQPSGKPTGSARSTPRRARCSAMVNGELLIPLATSLSVCHVGDVQPCRWSRCFLRLGESGCW